MKHSSITLVPLGLMLAVTSCATDTHTAGSQAVPADYNVSGAEIQGPGLNYAYGRPYGGQQGSEDPGHGVPGWPRTVTSGATITSIYEPLVDSWDGHVIEASSAVAIQTADQREPLYGVVTFNARTLVNKGAGVVNLEDLKITGVNFPSSSDSPGPYLQMLHRVVPGQLEKLALYRLEADFNARHPVVPAPVQPLNNTPPKIVISHQPAVLVSIDGPPAYRPVPQTGLQRVINTRALLLKDRAGRFYLRMPNGYLVAPSLEGKWTVATNQPDGAAQAEKEMGDSMGAEWFKNQAGVNPTSTTMPDIIVSTSPTELITFEGDPNFVPVPGTQLLFAANTTGDVFKCLQDQETYVLLSGRWFRSPSLDGPWEFVAGSKLPRDFAQIPDSSPKENVKASVPGTTQANEALIANSIPESARIPRNTPMAPLQIDGAPQLRPIAGTPLHYVANSASPVIEVDANSWYSCQNGVWFAAPSCDGPWAVTASVPDVIYSIPVSSPLHYLTYARVFDSNSDSVDEGYTPGYFGTEVSEDGTVVYGTGYDYDPWLGSVWYCPPETWGLGWDCCWMPFCGWGFGCGFGWDFGCGWGCFPGWGPFHHWHGHEGGGNDFQGHSFWGNTGRNLYHANPNGTTTGSPGLARPGGALSLGHAYNSRTGWLAGGQRAGVQSIAPRNRMSSGGFYGFPANRSFGGLQGSLGAGRGRLNFMNARGGFYHGGSAGGYHGGGGFFHGGSAGGYHGGGGFFHGGGGGGFHGGGGGGHGGGGGGGGGHR